MWRSKEAASSKVRQSFLPRIMRFPLLFAIPVLSQNIELGQCFKENKPKTPAVTIPSGFSADPKNPNKGIGSWFRANNKQDSTNGNSWCGYPYSDDFHGFAPSLEIMTRGENSVYPNPNWRLYGRRFCGLEANVTNLKNGRWTLMYIVDAFDDKWIDGMGQNHPKGSIDIMIESFKDLTDIGNEISKQQVVNVAWYLTGKRSEKYQFPPNK